MSSARVTALPTLRSALAPALLAAGLVCVCAFATSASANSLRDPMAPATPAPIKPHQIEQKVAPPPTVALELSAISYQREASQRSAIINGQWVSAGSTIAGATVVRIASNSVSLMRAGQELTLQLVRDVKIQRRASHFKRPES